MRIILITLTTVFVLTSSVFADKFQIKYQSGGSSQTVANTPVDLVDGSGKVVVRSRTDSYGRVNLPASNGNYTIKVNFKNGRKTASVVISGNQSLKEVYVK